ncbi:MAG: WecB/TagA/CpsF family glycosyltransferase [Polyangiaceae bacterium]|nr:WecB/TagA/CpsF family glycosyltransferase [Polyangiaceae bacterium]
MPPSKRLHAALRSSEPLDHLSLEYQEPQNDNQRPYKHRSRKRREIQSVPTSTRQLSLWNRRHELFGVRIADATMNEAADLLDSYIEDNSPPRAVYFVNAHTLNCLFCTPGYTLPFQRAATIFGDGVGVSIAMKVLHGLQPRDNVNGTDFLPFFLSRSQKKKRRIFLLGSAPGVARLAGQKISIIHPNWQVVGSHHGFFQKSQSAELIKRINSTQPDLLLVALGNPLQEKWIDDNLQQLEVPVAMGVGALLEYLAGLKTRAPYWMRKRRLEWLYRMLFHKDKFLRYFLGNPLFLWRMAHAKLRQLKTDSHFRKPQD